MSMMDQVLRVYQRTIAAVIFSIGYWLMLLYVPTDDIQLGIQFFRAGILTMGLGSMAVLNWMGGIDAILYARAWKRHRNPGRICLCLRVALHTYGSLALLMLSWKIFGHFTDTFARTRLLLLVSRLHLVPLVLLYYYVENGSQPVRWRRVVLKNMYR